MNERGRVAIFHPTDPLGHVPGGIDTIIRGILKWAPPDLEYTLFGATSDETARPVGQRFSGVFDNPNAHFLPLVTADARGRRQRIPLSVRYLAALARTKWTGQCRAYDALDFHRIETLALFGSDNRPRNVTVHQDMSIIRDPGCDIMWRHAPGVYEWLERRAFRGAERIYTVRQSAVDRYSEAYPEVAQRLSFLPTWVDTTIFHPALDAGECDQARVALRASLGLQESDGPVLVTVGRLDRQKDPLLLLQAFVQVLQGLPRAHLVFIGDGVLRPQVEGFISDAGINRSVTLLGVRPPHEIARIHRGADLFVLSSAYEGMPIAVLEALGAGLPVVTTPVGEVGLVLRDTKAGTILPDFRPETLADGIRKFLLDRVRGPCEASVSAIAPYREQRILSDIYQHHRRQCLGRPRTLVSGPV